MTFGAILSILPLVWSPSGKVGKVNISGATYELIKNHFQCVFRGKIQAKNKGEIEMYFVEKSYSIKKIYTKKIGFGMFFFINATTL